MLKHMCINQGTVGDTLAVNAPAGCVGLLKSVEGC